MSKPVRWEPAEVTSPRLAYPIPVIAAKSVPYLRDGNRLQSLNLYLPRTAETASLQGLPVTSLPGTAGSASAVKYQVYVHGGGWRDPFIDADTIEPTVAHAFSSLGDTAPVAIASLNYSLSPYSEHPTDPYDSEMRQKIDAAREAVHPQHLQDVLRGLTFLHTLGLGDDSYILTGHSCGATLVLQAALRSPSDYGIQDVSDIPRPAAVLALNGPYDLAALVHELEAPYMKRRDEFEALLSNAFGPDESVWLKASPAQFDADQMAERVRKGRAPRLIYLDQSHHDQVVPMDQLERLTEKLREVDGLQVAVGNRMTGRHATPWQEGLTMWESMRDVVAALEIKT